MHRLNHTAGQRGEVALIFFCQVHQVLSLVTSRLSTYKLKAKIVCAIACMESQKGQLYFKIPATTKAV